MKKNTPRPKDVIDKIKESGYKVKVIHYRYFGNRLLKNAQIRTLIKAMQIMNENFKEHLKEHGNLIETRGGKTEVEVSKGNVGYCGVSYCSLSDPFTYKSGAALALKRVVVQLPEPHLKELANF